ncbi:PEPxxWA-CTERM sorting domain-containing protein [Pseudoduganella sp. SL102]|uniref:PEPxxWA-CTERM sorting domain-containing protein n=1 Tax=Pseudoduganella sp. SL102 TaxID=2995154 RepID=UPI00248AB725|nr:PEPxxWA-CTERM sorting domain-containing protein [Pseudoduganella sp. SL102]WBS05630.1 PEPxxWA-CTERM sorting domain-containing protein [Pseudoduganella sp. SL102]
MKLTHVLSSTTIAVILLCTGSASATVYDFRVLSERDDGVNHVWQWQIDADETPDSIAPGSSLSYDFVPGRYPYGFSGYGDITFYHESQGGGMFITDSWNSSFAILRGEGDQIYSGSEADPVFEPGTYTMFYDFGGPTNFTLTISAVPEPATYAMMLGGLGLVGAALRRRQVK